MTLVEVLSAARRFSVKEEIELIQFLVEDLDTAEDISPLEPFKIYDLPTPYSSFGAGNVLMKSFSQM